MKDQRATKVIAPAHRRFLALGLGVAVAGSLGLTACGSSAKTTAAATPTTTGPATGIGTGGRGFPGASGSVAAVSGSSMEVQNPQSGQVTVSWKPSTTFTKTVTVSPSLVTAGECVTITGTSTAGTLVARSVVVSQPLKGSCARGAFGSRRFGGGSPSGRTFTPPAAGSGTPPTGPGGRTPRAGGGSSFASGKVTSVTSGTLVLSGTSSAGFTKGAVTKPTTETTIRVARNSATVYTETKPAAAAALAVGDCVAATGTTDSTGAVSASTIRITSTGGRTCTTGFGAPRAGTAGA